jgi:alkylhydroperoxidase family enzyme
MAQPDQRPFIVLLAAARSCHWVAHLVTTSTPAARSTIDRADGVRGFIAAIASRVDGAMGAWINWALDAGVSQATVDTIREGRPLPPLAPEESLALAVCAELTSGEHRLSDRTFAAALDHFGTRGLVELVVTLGYFALIAFPLNAFEIEMTSEQLAKRKPFARLPIPPHPGATPAGTRRPPFAPWVPPRPAPRIARVTRIEDLAPADRHFFDRVVRTRGRVAGPFEVLLHSPDLADRVAVVGEQLVYGTAIPAPARALTWLLTAAELDCDYEWSMACGAAQEAGLLRAGRCRGRGDALTGDGGPAGRCRFLSPALRGNHHVSDEAIAPQ